MWLFGGLESELQNEGGRVEVVRRNRSVVNKWLPNSYRGQSGNGG